MHIAVVLDHPNPASFSAAVARRFCAGAQDAGHHTELIDLHQCGFNPVWSLADIEADPQTPPADIRAYQEIIFNSEAICMVFPLFWWGMPAMMKGWIDRVWSWGWAYDQLEDTEKSLLSPRSALLLIPAGASAVRVKESGFDRAIEKLWSEGTFGYFGLAPRHIELLYGATGSASRRDKLLECAYEWGTKIKAPRRE